MLAADLALQFIAGSLLQAGGFVEFALGFRAASHGEEHLAAQVEDAGALRIDGGSGGERIERRRELALLLVDLG